MVQAVFNLFMFKEFRSIIFLDEIETKTENEISKKSISRKLSVDPGENVFKVQNTLAYYDKAKKVVEIFFYQPPSMVMTRLTWPRTHA